MTMSLFLIVIAVVVVALVGFLIVTLLKVNKTLEKTSILIDHLNEKLPPLLSDLQNTASNINAVSDTLTQGVRQAAAGMEYFKSFKLFGTFFDSLEFIRRGLEFIRNLGHKGESK